MKRTICLFIMTIIISTRNDIFSQSLGGNCPQKELTNEFCKAVDTLSGFLNEIRKSTTEGAWSQFIENAAMGSAAAFSVFGERATDLVNRFRTLGKDLDDNASLLIRAIDPGEKLTGEQLRAAMITNVNCYYTGSSGNDIKKTAKEGDGPGLQLMDGGPCEISLNTCSSTAASAHTSQLIACGFGSGGIWRWLGGWWGLGSGLVCLLGVEMNYNNAKATCIRNYCDCIHCNTEFKP